VVADAAPGAGTRPPGPAGAAGPGLGTMLSSVGAGRAVGALALVALTALLLAWGPDARLRGLWFDFCQRLAPRVRLSGPAVMPWIVHADSMTVGRLEGGGGPPALRARGLRLRDQ
jgi:hypothetical protein